MLSYQSLSGLTVVEHAADEQSVERELRKLRDSFVLVCTHRYGRRLYQVWQEPADWSTTREASWLVDWADDAGRPLPLSHALVTRVQQLLATSETAHARSLADANERRRADLDRQTSEAQQWIAENVLRAMKETRSPLFPRGQYLRRSRDKQRANGRSV